MTINYTPTGICPKGMTIEVEEGKVTALQVEGGCNGNLKGLSSLVVGMSVEDIISRLEGISCGSRPTSCPDQLAQALRGAL